MAFDTAISGLKAATADLGIIGNNVANASTTGFKGSRAEFADVYASSLLGAGSNATGKGVSLSGVTQQFAQGSISFTNNSLDMAISGTGFFMVTDEGAPLYTRAGSFSADNEGYIVNTQGNRLQGFQASDTGDILGAVGDMQVSASLIDPSATTRVDMRANLDSREAVPSGVFAASYDAFGSPATAPDPSEFNSSTSTTVYDELGNSHIMSLYFSKTTTANQWNVHTLIDGVTVAGPDTMPFQSNGQPDPTALPLNVDVVGWIPLDENGASNGASAQSLTIGLSEATQFGAGFSISSAVQDGFTTGQLSGLEIEESGVVFARYTNGQSNALGQVALVGFTNPNGLQPNGNSAWSETFASGQGTVGEPGVAGLGIIQSGALEDSNIEITEQLVNMIVAQRNFQANAQVIQTEDAVTQAIINLR